MQLNNTQFRYMTKCGVVPEAESVDCGVCDSVMTAKRGCYGPTSSTMAMDRMNEHYDSFLCPHHLEDWHRQVVALRKEIRETASTKIEMMLEMEINEILCTRKATKKVD